jgi:carboxylesterase type B
MPASKLPVLVYIQGGGYATNANSNDNGTEIIRSSGDNIVLVNFNYRVGVLGFLASDMVRQDGDLNVGLLDQRLLLIWVQEHISKVCLRTFTKYSFCRQLTIFILSVWWRPRSCCYTRLIS